MPYLILRVKEGFDKDKHPSLTQKAKIGDEILICHIPQVDLPSLLKDKQIISARVEKWLKTYFK